MVKLHDLVFEPYVSEEEINEAITKIADNLNADYKDEQPVFLSVLNGSFMFSSEIMKKYKGECDIQFVKLGSYEGTESTGDVKTLIGLTKSLAGKKVVILEDIVDTGGTLKELDQILNEKSVADYKVATLFHKPSIYREKFKLDYTGIEIPNEFIVGYGLDYDGLGRNLTSVYKRKS
ncbi:hypoxanthine phosphoribosyltransferase [Zunongwangia mangrovi]|uniref:Hypoxanthine phosphoribosyltransferase n=1 Tax=Zunongwangia mangrovi TaxID=1334022 RepID=A0A1I1K9H0_9FLAO|nr:phosphoribosyltransferase family protein [Zunongwangia mangrovi]SFC55338.1 hypoxanthine phosphoribosyltransferase [Zunongwangia mangrovi]